MGVSFETYLRRRWDVQRDVAATSPRRLNAGWGNTNHELVSNIDVEKTCFFNVKLKLLFFFLFFLSVFFSFTNIHDSHDSRGSGRYLFNSSLPLPPSSQTLRHYPGGYCSELTSAHS